MLKRQVKAYAAEVENTKAARVMPAIANKIRPDAV